MKMAWRDPSMNPIVMLALKAARRIVTAEKRITNDERPVSVDFRGQCASDLIREKLLAPDPCMISRIGSVELTLLKKHLNQKNKKYLRNIYDYVTGREETFWFDDKIKFSMCYSAGFFPCTDDALGRFADRFLEDLTQTDVLGSWLNDEAKLARYLMGAITD